MLLGGSSGLLHANEKGKAEVCVEGSDTWWHKNHISGSSHIFLIAHEKSLHSCPQKLEATRDEEKLCRLSFK